MGHATLKMVSKTFFAICRNCQVEFYISTCLQTDDVFYALDEAKVCRATALMLLKNAIKFNLREFQEVWQQSVPDGMSTSLDQLKVCI